MKVILLKDLKNIGRKHDIVEVSDGLAHNKLIPGREAIIATSQEIKKIENLKKNLNQNYMTLVETFSTLSGKLKDTTLELREKVSKEGSLYHQVDTKGIAQKIKEVHHIDPKLEWIHPESQIKKLGEYTIVMNDKSKENKEFTFALKVIE